MSVDPRMCYRVSRLYQSRGKGCAGNVIGVDGTLNWRSSARMCQGLRVFGRITIDFGCGDGRFMAMALAMGAYSVLGIEHPQNVAQQLIFCAVLEEMLLDLAGFQLTGLNAEWIPLDIDKVHCPGSFFFFFIH
jgi:tRNA G46 methylase TrmB